MNDFTKEELRMIFGHLPIETPERENDENYQKLYKKLKLMRDNYCEHRDRVANIDDDGCLIVQCARCDLVFWFEGS